MKIQTLVRILVIAVCVGWLWPARASPPVTLAHEGGPRLRLMVPQIMPGESLEVEGINLGTDLLVTVVLEKDGRRQVLGEALCDGHGDFIAFFALPEELSPGVYTVAAIDHSVAGMEVVMASSPIRVGSAGRFDLGNFTRPGPIVWASVGTLLLLLLAVPLALRQRRTAATTRVRLTEKRKVRAG